MFILLFISSYAFSSSDKNVIPVGKAELEKVFLYLNTSDCNCDEEEKIIKEDLSLYKKYFSFENNEATSSVKVNLLKKQVEGNSEFSIEMFNNIIKELFELYGFTMNEGDTKTGGYKLKRRSLKKYKKVVYMKDKTRRRRKYRRKSPKRKKKRTKRRRVSGRSSSTRKNKYVLTYIRSLTRGQRKYN